VPRFGVTGAVCAPCLYRRKGSYVAGLNGLIRKNFGKMFGEQLVLDANMDATPTHSPLYLRPTGAPSSAVEGAIYFDDTTEALEWYDGSAWLTGASLDAASQTFSGNVAVTGTLAATGIVTGPRKIVSVTAASHDLEATDSGALIVLNRAAGIAITLPTAANGLWFDFVVDTTLTGNGTITAEAGDLLTGTVTMVDTDTTFTHSLASPDGTDDLIITMNGTTTGGLVPSHLSLYCVSATNWVVKGELYHSSNVATPFS
jgi:hypothetical protein